MLAIIYIILCIIIPTIIVILNSKKKHIIIVGILIFLILFSFKLLFKYNDKTNCIFNNVCTKEDNKIDDTTITSTTTTTTTSTTTTTTAVVYDGKIYPVLDLVSGEKVSVGTSKNGYEIFQVNGVYYVDNQMIVNKSYPLPSTYIPENTYRDSKGINSMCTTCINKTAYSAWLDMVEAAKKDGINLFIKSGYRPYSVQVWLYDSYVQRDGKEAADTYSARAGYSEHQSGLCFDINLASSSFNNTKEAKWINDNAYKFGYTLRFPNGKTEYTGYKYESWHVRYVGTALAYKLYNNGDWISLEEYYGLDSIYE